MLDIGSICIVVVERQNVPQFVAFFVCFCIVSGGQIVVEDIRGPLQHLFRYRVLGMMGLPDTGRVTEEYIHSLYICGGLSSYVPHVLFFW